MVTKWGFGMAPFKKEQLSKYKLAFTHVSNFIENKTVSLDLPDQISIIKGFFNRICKQDQWNWFIAFAYIDFPPIKKIEAIVSFLSELRRALLSNDVNKQDIFSSRLVDSGFLEYKNNFFSFDEKKEELVEILQTLLKMIFRPENLMVDFVGEEKAVGLLDAPVEAFKAALYTGSVEMAHYIPEVSRKNEGFLTSGQVNYVCRAGNFRKSGLKYTGALRVLKVMLGYEYLWVNVRVKGGAYGCMCSFGRSGDSYFVSYRDPNLGKTIDVYEKAADAIAEFTADERTMTQYIIGAVSDLDVPMNPAAKGLYSLSAYMTGLDDAALQRERDELLSATVEDIRALSAHIRAFMQEDLLCVVGTASKVKEEQERFLKVENLF